MEHLTSLIPLIFLIFLAACIVTIIGQVQHETLEVQQIRLQYATNKATDAALWEMVNNAEFSLDMDVHDLSAIQINPRIALDTFVDVFLVNYGMPLTDSNRVLIRTRFMPIFVVVANDGYYIATLQQVDTGSNTTDGAGFDLSFSMKFPFSVTVEPSTTNGLTQRTTFGLELSQRHVWRFDHATGGFMRRLNDPLVRSAIGNNQEVQLTINNIILSHIANEIQLINSRQNTLNQFFIPNDLNVVTTVNPIQGVSVIALMQNVNLSTRIPISTLSVGGARVVQARVLIGYIRNGQRLYSWADVSPPGVDAIAMFSTPFEAAYAGFFADTEYIFNTPGRPPTGQFDWR